jgi:hypothetical protein
MRTFAKIILSAFAFVGIHSFIAIFFTLFYRAPAAAASSTYFKMAWYAGLEVLTCAAAAAGATFVWRNFGSLKRGGLVSTALTWALIGGSVGFSGGFFGPMLFAGGGNQGPLLGIFITGPLGVLFGGIAGAAKGLLRKKTMSI